MYTNILGDILLCTTTLFTYTSTPSVNSAKDHEAQVTAISRPVSQASGNSLSVAGVCGMFTVPASGSAGWATVSGTLTALMIIWKPGFMMSVESY